MYMFHALILTLPLTLFHTFLGGGSRARSCTRTALEARTLHVFLVCLFVCLFVYMSVRSFVARLACTPFPTTVWSCRESAAAAPRLFYSIPFHSILFHSILFYSILFLSIPFHSVPFYSILFLSIPFHSVLFYSILSICLSLRNLRAPSSDERSLRLRAARAVSASFYRILRAEANNNDNYDNDNNCTILHVTYMCVCINIYIYIYIYIYSQTYWPSAPRLRSFEACGETFWDTVLYIFLTTAVGSRFLESVEPSDVSRIELVVVIEGTLQHAILCYFLSCQGLVLTCSCEGQQIF